MLAPVQGFYTKKSGGERGKREKWSPVEKQGRNWAFVVIAFKGILTALGK